MKNIIIWACVTISLIRCNSGIKQQGEIQTQDACEISFCDIIVAYKKSDNDYSVVNKKERELNCKDGKRQKYRVILLN
jgi:hypothetical protein